MPLNYWRHFLPKILQCSKGGQLLVCTVILVSNNPVYWLGQKKCLVSGNPINPSFLGPTLIFFFFGHLRVFLLFIGYFLMIFPIKKKFAYLPTLKNIKTFPETRHFFFFLPYAVSRDNRIHKSCWKTDRSSLVKLILTKFQNIFIRLEEI